MSPDKVESIADKSNIQACSLIHRMFKIWCRLSRCEFKMIAVLLDCRKQQIHRGMKLLRLYWKIWMQIKLWCLRKYEWIWAWVWAWAHGQWHVKVDCGKDLDKTSYSKDQIKWMKWFIVCRQLVISYQQHRRNEFIIFTRVNKTENLLVTNIKWKYARTKCSLVYTSR